MILLQVKKLVFLDVPPFKTKKYLGGITYLTLLGDWSIKIVPFLTNQVQS